MLEGLKSYLSQQEFNDAVDDFSDYMKHKGRSKRWRETSGKGPSKYSEKDRTAAAEMTILTSLVGAEQPLTPGKLIGSIANITMEASPDGWETLAIGGEVKTVSDANGKHLTEISADFQALMVDGTLQKNLYGGADSGDECARSFAARLDQGQWAFMATYSHSLLRQEERG